jgi:hypothetical protein
MPDQARIVSPGPDDRTVRAADGRLLTVPAGWVRLPPGDAGLTRRVKAGGPTWTVQEKKGRKTFSRGVWAPAERVEAARAALAAERATPAYASRRATDAARREREQAGYVEDFRGAVLAFLAFAPGYGGLAARLADAVTAHATPVGSGTVARTRRISVEDRAAAAVIAWLRHHTTAYDTTAVPRVKGARREIRRRMAEQSRRLLDRYRAGMPVDPAACPLARALAGRADVPAGLVG